MLLNYQDTEYKNVEFNLVYFTLFNNQQRIDIMQIAIYDVVQ